MSVAPLGTDLGPEHRVYGSKEGASFQVIILGANGGPREDTITGLLVRAPQAEWRKNSVIAVDAGAHLASIIAILQKYMPHRSSKIAEPGHSTVLEEGPFAGLRFPYISAKANSLYIFRELLHSFLITHPHLDHIAALGINTPALEFGREAKAIVALPPVIEAIKTHIFNDSIWPNLSDEGHGVGFVTYRRLTEGGNQRFGSGDTRGYVSVCDGLATKCLAVTHGKCQRHHHSLSHQRGESGGFFSNDYNFPARRMSRMSDHDGGYMATMAQQQAFNASMYNQTQMQMPAGPTTPGVGGGPGSAIADKDYNNEPITSSAFFIRNDVTGKEILIFGDVEPDSVSMAPRTYLVWDEAAPKVASGTLKAIFIECSYDDDVRDQDLFGHLCPRHLIVELETLARRVVSLRNRKSDGQRRQSLDVLRSPQMTLKEPPSQSEIMKKRKRGLNGEIPGSGEVEQSPRLRPADPPPFPTHQYVGARVSSQPARRASRDISGIGGHSPLQRPLTPSRTPRHVQFQGSPQTQYALPQSIPEAESLAGVPQSMALPPLATGQSSGHNNVNSMEAEIREPLHEPLKGLTVHVIHVKDTMVDGTPPGDIIAEQLRSRAAEIGLGCEFDVTDCGESIWV